MNVDAIPFNVEFYLADEAENWKENGRQTASKGEGENGECKGDEGRTRRKEKQSERQAGKEKKGHEDS